MKRRDGEQPLASALSAYVRRLDRGGKHLAAARVAAAWPEAVGPDIARHTSGVFLRDGELVAYVDSPVWAAELSAMGEPLRKVVNTALGEELVGSVRFSVSKRVGEQRARESAERATEEFYSEDQVDTVPLDPQEIEQVRQSASVIGDPELREAAIRATVKDLEWKRGLARRDAAAKRGPHVP
jgi:hypothetical protein